LAVEFFGLAIFTLAALIISLGLGFLSLLRPRLRRFALAICTTPPAAVAFLFFVGWAINDSGPVCGPDPEWDRCPSFAIRIAGWLAWTLGIFAVAVGAYWGQKVIEAAITLWFDTKAIKLFKDQ
jgi:hypothetical protein